MRTPLLLISTFLVTLSPRAQSLRISAVDGSGHLLATNTAAQQRYSLGWTPSIVGLGTGSLTTLQSRVAHSTSAAFRVQRVQPVMFLRVFLDPFAISDLAGDWTMHLLTSADDPTDFAGWGRFELTFDATGQGTFTAARRSNGDNFIPPPFALTVGSDGTGLGLTPSPVMSLDKATLYGVMNDGGGGFNLFTLVRRTASGFATADLAGQWTRFCLVSPGPLPEAAGWGRFELTLDADGNGVYTAAQFSTGSTALPPPTKFGVAADGTVTGMTTPSAVMAVDKNTIVGVGNDPGQNGGYDLCVMVRRGTAGFDAADAEGQWTMFLLGTRSGPPAFAGWGRHEVVIDAQGIGTFTAAQRSNGDAHLPPPFTLTVATAGTANGLAPTPVMGLDKNTIYGAMTEQTGGFSLYLMVRR